MLFKVVKTVEDVHMFIGMFNICMFNDMVVCSDLRHEDKLFTCVFIYRLFLVSQLLSKM